METSRIKVSILCNVFNHGKFLERTLQGFVEQQTDFEYEVIIHDDASTDDSPSIIRRYAEAFPSLFVPILETENQYSKGVPITKSITLPLARGKYIALCEGDDFWVDSSKLQRQFDFLETHLDYSLCLHNAYVIDEYLGCVYLSEPDIEDKDKSMTDVILEGGGKINPTASMFFRNQLPNDWPSGPVGDHFYLIMMASMGKIRWFAKPMSVYRYRTGLSWTNVNNHGDKKLSSGYYKSYEDTLCAWDDLTDYKWHDAFAERIAMQEERRRRDAGIYGVHNPPDQKPSLKGQAIVLFKKFAPRQLVHYIKVKSSIARLHKNGTYITSVENFDLQ